MSNAPRAGGRSVTPLLLDGSTDGVLVAMDGGHNVFTLAANNTYALILGGPTAPFLSATLTGMDAALVITSATIQDTDHHAIDVPNTSVVVGEWLSETPSTAYVATAGTGWSVTNGVVAAAGTGVGGARWNVAETASYRTRLLIVVGAAGGRVRVSSHGKA